MLLDKVKRKADKVRGTPLFLDEVPTQLEKRLADLCNHVRLKPQKRNNETTASIAYEIICMVREQGDSPVSSFVALSLQEIDKRKKRPELHRRKCFMASFYIQEAEKLKSSATANELRCLRYAKRLIYVISANQIIPGDY